MWGMKNGDPQGTLFKIPAGGSVTCSIAENQGTRFQKYDLDIPADQKAKLDSGGTVEGVTAPGAGHIGTLYETNYVTKEHASYEDLSPLDGANAAMTVSGTGGRTLSFTEEDMAGAPSHNPDGTVPGLGPDASTSGNAASNPALRDYYEKISKDADGTRRFYFNSSVGGEADKATVQYKGSPGQVRTTVTIGGSPSGSTGSTETPPAPTGSTETPPAPTGSTETPPDPTTPPPPQGDVVSPPPPQGDVGSPSDPTGGTGSTYDPTGGMGGGGSPLSAMGQIFSSIMAILMSILRQMGLGAA
jgi:hypothetical protein